MRKFFIILFCVAVVAPVSMVSAKNQNQPDQKIKIADHGKWLEQDDDGENIDENNGDGNSRKHKWESGYNPRSENARNHMSIVAQTVENLLAAADRMDDPGIGEDVREVARHHGQTSEKIAEKQDQINQRSGVVKFFIGPDYAALEEVQQQMEQIRNQVRELNQLRTKIEDEADQEALQNQIEILELQLQSLQSYVDSEEEVFSLFGWLLKLF